MHVLWLAGAQLAAAGVGGGGFAMPGAPSAPATPAPAAPGTSAYAAHVSPATPAVWITLELIDGTTLGGSPAEAGPVFVSSLGTVQPAWRDVATLQLSEAPGGDTIRLRSGDQARGDLRSTLIGITSVLGRARIGTPKIKQVLVGSGATAAPELDDGLVLYLPFDADERGRLIDRSPAANEARLMDAHVMRPGRVGGALECDGAAAWVRVESSASVSPRRLTLAAWCKANREITRDQHMLITRQPHGMPGGYALGFEPDENGDSILTFKVMTRVSSPGYNYCRVPDRFQPGTWHHVAATYDGKRQRMYVDGELKSSNPTSAEITYDSIAVHIGSQRDGQVTGFWDGLIDEVRIYNRALDDSEIRRLALIGGAASTPGATPAAGQALRLEVRLEDQTVVRGTAAWTTLPLVSATLGKLDLPWARVSEVRSSAMEDAVVTLDSGDVLKGALGFQKATLESSLGRVTLMRENLKTIRVLRD